MNPMGYMFNYFFCCCVFCLLFLQSSQAVNTNICETQHSTVKIGRNPKGQVPSTSFQGRKNKVGPGSSYKWSYNSYKKGYNSSYQFMRPFIGVITNFIYNWFLGPPCMSMCCNFFDVDGIPCRWFQIGFVSTVKTKNF